MILQSLIDYYQRLENDPSQQIAPFGYSWQKTSFVIVLEKDGSLHAIQDGRTEQDGKLRPTPMIVPGQAKPSGSGLNPCFLWDNPAYLLGFSDDPDKAQRAIKSFEAFRDRHLGDEEFVKDHGFSAVCRFLEKWEPKQTKQQEILAEVGPGFGVFRIRGESGYVHDRPAIKQYWENQLKTEDESDEAPRIGVSLINGQEQPLARLHEPKIKGVIESQSSGALLVSFNLDAFTSYGKASSYNAPVGVQDAFRYATALNHMLADERHRTRIGDATVVFWSDRPTVFESAFSHIVNDFAGSGPAEDSATTARVQGFLEAMRQGRPHDGLDEPNAKFFVLGLSPNAARVSVRFWLVGTVEQFADRLAQHFADLEMTGEPPNARPWSLQLITDQTARDRKDVAPQLAGEVARAILSGSPYPAALFVSVLRRIRADQTINYHRAAILKAHLTREARLAGLDKEIPVSLNKDHPEPAYHMGRLFAAIEKTQTDALPGLNKTVREGYLGSAATTPATVFPRLLRLHQHHLAKLENPGQRINREKIVQEILSHLDDRFPVHFSLEQQGLFYIGYYHQRQDFFTKHDDAANNQPHAITEA
ncbi:MAG: type I-C CRISPR-associated protein Cas8c/Csd1 [Phycisphaeraceae bacterium]|nr:type I-C CRISPR-associated protein Cas8c/Csd1 [Phycisphaeraceae bacterium]